MNLIRSLLLGKILLVGVVLASPTGSMNGRIIDRDTHQPVPGANIILESTDLGAASDVEGYFLIEKIPVGSYTLRVDMMGYKSQARANVRALANRPSTVNIALEPTILEAADIVVTAGYFEKVKDAATSVRSVDIEEIRSDPVGSHDILSMMQSLPAVVSGADQTNEIIVRGGSPGENLFVMDHLDIPYPVHYPQQGAGGGPVTMVTTDFIERIDFFAGSFPARYGDKLSSVMDVTVREGHRSGHESSVSFDMAGFGASLEGPLAENSSYLFSVKRSFLDFVIQQSGLQAIPTYWTLQGKIVYDLNPKEKLSLNYLGGIDAINIVGEDNPQNRGAENVDYSSQQHTLGLTYKNLYSKQGYVLASLGQNLVNIGVDVFRVTDTDPHETYYEGITVERETILKTDLVHKINKNLEVSGGLKLKIAPNTWDLMSYRTELVQYGYAADSLTPALAVSREVFYRDFFDNPSTVVRPIDTLATFAGEDTTYEETYQSFGVFAQLKFRPIPRFELTWGTRVEYNAYLDKSNLSPRLNMNYLLLQNLKLNLAVGRYFQAPFNTTLIYNGQNSRDLHFYYADQVAAGLEYLPFEDTRFTLEVYQKEFRDMPVNEYLVDRNGNDSLGTLKNLGEGRSKGIEFFLQKKFSSNWYGTFSYSHSISEGVDPRKSGTVYYPWDYDYRDVMSLVGGYKIRYMDYRWYQRYKETTLASMTSWIPLAPADEYEISFRLRYAGGKPYTPRIYDHNHRRWYTSSSADWNTHRMGDYIRFDIMLLQRFYFEKMNLVAFWDIMNVLNRDNPWDYVYNEDGTRDIALQYKTFPVGGITLEF